MKAVLALVAVVALFAFVSAETEQGPIRCSTCQFVIKEAETFANSSVTQAGLTKIINGLCAKVNMATFCNNYVVPYIPQIINSIVQKTDPVKVCTRIRLCANNSVDAVEVDAAYAEAAELSAKAGLRCSACEAIVDYVEKNISGPANQDKVQQLLSQACQRLPVAKDVCTRFVAPTVAKLASLIASKVTPAVACTKLNLCQQA